MVKMRNIIDTWKMIEKYSISEFVELNSMVVLIPKNEFERLLASVANKEYIKNLRAYIC